MKPTIFLSSTIYDFKDLRSSIKWWLEENGYRVNASEFNDFDKPLDANSYEACLKAIDNSDYYILLIGNRFGGLFDQQISITQMEYRYAYQRMTEGKMKLINFVRYETSIKLEEYKQQIKANPIKIDDMSKDQKEKHRLFLFLKEARRVDDIIEGKGPKNNWVHQFDGFPDILSALENELGDKIGLGFKNKRFIVSEEVIRNLKKLSKPDNTYGILPKGFVSNKLFANFKIDFDNPIYTLTSDQQINLGVCYVSFWLTGKLNTSRIESIYNDGFFLEYDIVVDDYVAKELQILASTLLQHYETFNRLYETLYREPYQILSKLRKSPETIAKIESSTIFSLISLCKTVENIENYSKGLFRKLHNIQFKMPSPVDARHYVPEEASASESNDPSDDQIRDFLKSK